MWASDTWNRLLFPGVLRERGSGLCVGALDPFSNMLFSSIAPRRYLQVLVTWVLLHGFGVETGFDLGFRGLGFRV